MARFRRVTNHCAQRKLMGSQTTPTPKRRSSKWVSTSVLEADWNSDLAQWCSGEYHANNFKNIVYFAEACTKVPKNVVVIEIGPHGLFQRLLKSSLSDSCKIVSLAKRDSKSPLKHLLTTLGELYASGLQLDLGEIYPPPEYPVSRGTPSLVPLVSWNHEESWPINTHYGNPILNHVQLCLRDKTSRHLLGHKINDTVVVPLSFFISEVLKSFEKKHLNQLDKSWQIVFKSVCVHTPLIASAKDPKNFYIQISSSSFEVIESKNVLISGSIYMDEKNHLMSPEPSTNRGVDIKNEWIPDNEVYQIFLENNINISDSYCTIQKILVHDKGFSASILWKNDLNINLNSMMQLKMFADLQSQHDIPLLPSWFRSLVIDKQIINNFTQGSLAYITFDSRTNIIRGPGIEIEVLRTSVFPTILPPPINMNIQQVQFIDQPSSKTLTFIQFLSLSLQVVKNTFHSSLKIKTKLKINDDKFIEPFQKVFEVQPFLKADVEECSNFQITDLMSTDVLLLVTEDLNQQLNKDIKKCTGRVFVLIKNTTVDDTYTTIIQQRHNGSVYRLITRVVKLPNKILEVTIKNNSLWKDNIKQGLKLPSNNVSPIVLIKNNSESLLQVVQEIENIKSVTSFRYVILSEGSHQFDLTKTFFREQLFKGLRQNILKNNTWGSYNVIPCVDNFFAESDESELSTYINKDSKLSIEYMGSLNSNTPKEEVCTQYSGIDNERKHVMGILKCNTKNKRLGVDDVFKWYISPEWTLQEAAKLPLAYTMAYYCLVVKARVESGNSILIHDGCSQDGQAFIRVAQSFNCKIYVTTYNKDQSNFLKSIFPKLNGDNILDLDGSKFEIQLNILTKWKGCRIVINTVPTEFLWASLRCVKKYGIFIQVGPQDVDVHTQFGTLLFIKNIALYGVKDLMNVMNSSVETKNHLKQLVENGIKDGTVDRFYEEKTKSFSTSLNVHNPDKEAVSIKLHSSDHSFVKKDKSYVIIGSATNLWTITVNWLLQQEAKKLIFVIDGTASVTRRSQRIIYSLVQKHSDVSFVMTSAERFNSVEERETLLRELTTYSKIEAIFCVEMNNANLRNIDGACRNVLPNLRHFVCMQSDADEVCESRSSANASCVNVQCSKSVHKPEAVLKHMKKLIESAEYSKPVSVVVGAASEHGCPYRFLEKYTLPHLCVSENVSGSTSEYLPRTVDELLGLNVDLPEYPRFVQRVSKSLPTTDKNSLLPVFIVPGLGLSRVQPLIGKIMHPVYCAEFPAYVNSVESAALGLIWPLKQIQAEGPYTIVGETWGGTIAVELTKMMEGFGDTVNLVLLDGCPSDNQKRLKLLNNVDFEVFRESPEKKEEINSSIDVLMNQLMALKNCIPNNTPLVANTVIARPSTSDILESCINFEKNHIGKLTVHISNKTSFTEFINSLEAATIINENASFKW